MFKDKTVIVTGGSRGIGAEVCRQFAQNGANIVVNYASSNEPVNLVEELKSYGVNVVSYRANVASFDEAKELISFAKKTFGTIDILVNNAGITRDNLLLGMKEEEFDDVIDVNLKGTFNMMKHAIKIMLKQKSGTIINMSSVSGVLGNAGQVNYSASKAGVIGMTKATAREVASRGITVNAVAPGFIVTDMTDVLSEDVKNTILTSIPLSRFGETKEVAETVLFLANSKYITGQVISVDGGMAI